MTITLAVNENNDLFVSPDGNINLVRDINSVLQVCAHVAKAQLTEMVLAYDQGIPNFETIWTDATDTLQYEFYLRQALLAVDNVTGIANLVIDVRDNTLFYTATIQTTFGEAEINGISIPG